MIAQYLGAAILWTHNRVADLLSKRKGKNSPDDTTKIDPDKDGVLVGELLPSTRFPGPPTPLRMGFKTRLRHDVISGQSGSGKSTLIRSLLIDDLARGNGVVNFDYRGESTDLILKLLAERFTPEELEERLVLLDLRQRSAYGDSGEPVVAFNPLLEIGNDGYAATAFFLDVLRQVWGEGALGVQLIDDLRHVTLALTTSPSGPYTILDVERMLSDREWRTGVLAGVHDPIVVRFFERFDKIKDPESRVLPVTNKLSPLTSTHRRLRDTLGGTEKVYSFRTHFEKVKNPIVLVCLAADETAKSVAGIVGALLLSASIRAVMRSDREVGAEPTQGVHFILDEVANISSAIEEPLGELIREGRKFGAFATVAFQTPSSLSTSIRNLLLDTVGSMFFFSQGPQQAEILAGWINSDDMPKMVVRTLLMGFKPGEALVLRQGQPIRRMKAYEPPLPRVEEEKVRALRRAALARWGSPPSGGAATPSERPTGPQPPIEGDAAIEAREVEFVEEPAPAKKPARRRGKGQS